MYDLGDIAPLSIVIRDETGVPTNAAAVVCTITLPDGTTVTPAPSNPTVGTYEVDYVTTMVGWHRLRWTSTGPTTAFADVFNVRPATVGAIVSLTDARAQLNGVDTAKDEELRLYIDAATGLVEKHLGKSVVRRTRTERHWANGWVAINWPPVLTIDTVTAVDGSTTWDVNNLSVSDAGIITALTGVGLSGEVDVTYTAGMTVVPGDYYLATLIIVQHLWLTQRGRFGVTMPGGQSPEPPMGMGYAIPNRAAALLGERPPLVG